MNADGYVNGLDIQGFLDVWGMEVPACESLPSAYYELFCPADLNGNGMVDDDDIWIFVDYLLSDEEECAALRVTVQDCNGNRMLDAADLYYGTSEDCNSDLIPDDCQLNCGDIPDDCLIAQGAPDCNGNGRPDGCDLKLGPRAGSIDCNENGIPDECDVANETSCDTNLNGIPDECEIVLPLCYDMDENGCCDLEMGGELLYGEWEPDLTEAWAAFFAWCEMQEWGPEASISTQQQFANMVEKMQELGLPVSAEWPVE
jgi:hypothetical protein